MTPLRRNALILLAVATLVPVAAALFYVFHVYTEYVRRGLAFEGKGALFGILLVLGCAAVLWLSSLAVYVASLLKNEAVSNKHSRLIDLGYYLVLPIGLWYAFRLLVPS